MSAELMYQRLRGLFCIYKPPGQAMQQVIHTIQEKLSRDLNSMPCRPPRKIIQFDETKDGDCLPVITTVPDLADHPLVVGPRYKNEDFNVTACDALSTHSSGVTVMALGTPGLLRKVSRSRQIRVYHMKGELGRASSDFSSTGRLLRRTTYDHVTPAKMDRIVSIMQASHQKNMFAASNLNLQSQEAYDLAVKGLIRPRTREAGPVIYGLKCIDFQVPHFTLEIHAVNETDVFMKSLVHRLGLHLRSTAMCTQLRRVRYGRLDLDAALLHKHWQAEHVVANIARCRPLLQGALTEEHQPTIGEVTEDAVRGLRGPDL